MNGSGTPPVMGKRNWVPVMLLVTALLVGGCGSPPQTSDRANREPARAAAEEPSSPEDDTSFFPSHRPPENLNPRNTPITRLCWVNVEIYFEILDLGLPEPGEVGGTGRPELYEDFRKLIAQLAARLEADTEGVPRGAETYRQQLVKRVKEAHAELSGRAAPQSPFEAKQRMDPIFYRYREFPGWHE